MPNWVEGSFKIRSKDIDNVKNFLKNAFEYTCSTCPDKEQCRPIEVANKCYHRNCYGELVHIDDDGYEDDGFEVNIDKLVYLTGTSRMFIGSDYKEIDEYCSSKYPIISFPFQAAWSIKPDELIPLSKKYNVDFRLYGFEMGMEFCQEIEILNGELTLDREIHYKDWDWECPMPRMGG